MNVIEFLKTLPHVESGVDYLNAPDYYPFLNSLAKDFKPKTVLEIGVRFGYSAVAFIYGNSVKKYVGIDFELYDQNSMDKCRLNLQYLNGIQAIDLVLLKLNTQEISDLSFLESQEFDLIHIDGDHSYEGALNDMKIFWNALTIGGHMLVDDSLFIAEVGAACAEFAGLINEPGYNVKTLRGTYVFLKTKVKAFPLSTSFTRHPSAHVQLEQKTRKQ